VKVVVVTGGVGGARFLRGIVDAIDPAAVTAIVNVGDDLEVLGLSVSPDLDSVLYALAGISDALYDLHEPEPSQSFTLIASSVAGYTSVPLVSTCAADVSFAGSTLPLPMMCMTRTPCANR